MPWKIETREGRHCVVKADSGKVVKCHDTAEAAQKHMAAIYAHYKPNKSKKESKPPFESVYSSHKQQQPEILNPVSAGYSSSAAKGGFGSGNFLHHGRPGAVGGSSGPVEGEIGFTLRAKRAISRARTGKGNFRLREGERKSLAAAIKKR